MQELAGKVPPEHLVRPSPWETTTRATTPITPIRLAFRGFKAPLVQLLVLHGAPVMHDDFRYGVHDPVFTELLSWVEAELATRYAKCMYPRRAAAISAYHRAPRRRLTRLTSTWPGSTDKLSSPLCSAAESRAATTSRRHSGASS